ncbi:MAG: PPA1309 family protein [Propioniciclava sp.]
MTSDALIAALAEIERHVGRSGWDQPARLFALVPTHALLAAEPSLSEQLERPGGIDDDALSSIEQDGFTGGDDILEALARIQWPTTVHGVAISLERLFLPRDHEGDLPDDPEQAADRVAHHEARQDVRVVVGVLRAGDAYGLARVRSHPEDLLSSPDLVPGLAESLAQTLTT